MTTNVICNKCNFEIYFKEHNENEFLIIASEKKSIIDKIILIEKVYDDYGEKYCPFDESLSIVISQSDHSIIRCPSCNTLHYFGETNDEFIALYSLESQTPLPMMGTKEDQYIALNYDPFEDIAKSYFSNTDNQIPSYLQCACGNSELASKGFQECDYYTFPFYLTLSLVDLEETGYCDAIPANERINYLLKLSCKTFECNKCNRLTFIGKDMDNNQFKAIYKRDENSK